jgi:uncharacterized protein YbbC (DUF1343 family)
MRYLFCVLLLLLCSLCSAKAKVVLGIERLLNEESFRKNLKGKKVALVTNHTAVDHSVTSSRVLLKKEAKDFKLVALFAPEHGLLGVAHAGENVENAKDEDGIPVYSLHGATRRPTKDMLKNVDVLVFDIQDIGSRSYTYISTLFYVMEEAAKYHVKVIVADRPNPMGGNIVDGLMLDPDWRSFLGYVNVPYCHGMTVGELSLYFNKEYKVNCDLLVVPMKGWKRSMTFSDTDLSWVPTSPQIPEPDTPFYYPTTGLLGELQLVNIGVGYTLPFKLVGAPWIKADEFAQALNEKKFPGVQFRPIYYKPFFGSFAQKDCQGVHIVITDIKQFKPVETQYLLIGTLKSLYPQMFEKALKESIKRKEMFCKANGTEKVYKLLAEEKYIVYPLKKLCQDARKEFLPIRKNYLLSDYQDAST